MTQIGRCDTMVLFRNPAAGPFAWDRIGIRATIRWSTIAGDVGKERRKQEIEVFRARFREGRDPEAVAQRRGIGSSMLAVAT